MTNHSAAIVQKLWNYCNVLRDDGLSYGDYVEQLTYLLFLKMAHERTQPPWNQPSAIPPGYDWPALASRDGDALEAQYRDAEVRACFKEEARARGERDLGIVEKWFEIEVRRLPSHAPRDLTAGDWRRAGLPPPIYSARTQGQ